MRHRKLIATTIAVVMAFTVSGSVDLTQKGSFSEPPQTVSIKDVSKAYVKNAALLKQAGVEAAKVVTPVHKNHANTPDVNSEYEALSALIQQYKDAAILNQFQLNSLDIGNMVNQTPATYKQEISDMNSITATAVTDLKERTQQWATQVDELNAAAAPPGESPEQKVLRLQEEIGQPFPFKIDHCRIQDGVEIAWGCYNAGDDFYTLTPEAFDVPECNLRTTIAHEHWHYLQWKKGLMSGKNQKSNAWLEDDARAHQWMGGGC
jgi:hypothetical protein